MSILSDCCNPCPAVTAVNVPGAPGAAGTAGGNAFTKTSADFNIPLVQYGNVTVSVVNSQWMAVGEIVFASDGTDRGTFSVVSIPTVAPFNTATLEWLQYANDSAANAVIDSGAIVTPAGVQATISYPTSVLHGGTGSSLAANARSNLGAAANGSNSDITSLNTLSTPLSVSQGGTGAVSIAAALTAFAIQWGVVPLVGGTVQVINKYITANSAILVSLQTVDPTAAHRTSFANYKLTSITNGLGSGSFIITAITDANATLSSCVDIVAWHILG